MLAAEESAHTAHARYDIAATKLRPWLATRGAHMVSGSLALRWGRGRKRIRANQGLAASLTASLTAPSQRSLSLSLAASLSASLTA